MNYAQTPMSCEGIDTIVSSKMNSDDVLQSAVLCCMTQAPLKAQRRSSRNIAHTPPVSCEGIDTVVSYSVMVEYHIQMAGE